MKKFGSLLMSALLCASLLAGCSSSASVSQSTVPETISTAEGAIETGSEEVSLEEMTAAKTETSTEALEESSDDTVVRVGGLKGPTTMGLVKLMDDAKNGTAANNYEFTMVTAADELTGLVASGKVDIALLPANVASVLYHKTEGKVSVIDINTLGVLYLVSGDSSISSIENLSGKTVYLPGKGTTPEYVLRYLISASGLSDDADTLARLNGKRYVFQHIVLPVRIAEGQIAELDFSMDGRQILHTAAVLHIDFCVKQFRNTV